MLETLEEKYIKRLKDIDKRNGANAEGCHIELDEMLCELLKELGFEKLVIEYDEIHKWYS